MVSSTCRVCGRVHPDLKRTCHFFVSMLAPGGLAALAPHLGTCKMPLGIRVSGYNGKTILGLADGAGEGLEWEMDSSDTDVMSAQGCIVGEVDRSVLLLQSLSDCLRTAGVPHEVAADIGTETGEVTRRWNFEWADE